MEAEERPVFALFRFRVLYWTQTEELKRGRPGNKATVSTQNLWSRKLSDKLSSKDAYAVWTDQKLSVLLSFEYDHIRTKTDNQDEHHHEHNILVVEVQWEGEWEVILTKYQPLGGGSDEKSPFFLCLPQVGHTTDRRISPNSAFIKWKEVLACKICDWG